ncbi:hypothetical protein [Streptomyces sp. MUM 2J]|uniref:hypothetical protein n=1 Tax=Streptomyces sp. MUM 2J TaxID=2791987 RepID=UPI001F034844|nr:hypothetical protein [Streptomyces sp. MUM 2J]
MSCRTRHCGGRADRGSRTTGVTGHAAGAVRPVRAALFAALCVVTTALGHTLMSGELLPWWAAGLAFAAVVPGGWWLTGRERAALTVVGSTVAVQALLHVLFAAASRPVPAADGAAATGGACCSGVPEMMSLSHTGMTMHHGMPSGGSGPVPGLSVPGFVSAVTHGGSAGMLLAHALAAALCGLWLWRGEAAVHRIARALATVLVAPLRRILRASSAARGGTGARSCRAVRHGAEHWRPTESVLRHVVVRRGPPRHRLPTGCLSPRLPRAARS